MQLVDNFAGGGGASLGIEQALGRPVDIAVNHDAEAVAMHRANHPRTTHYLQDVWHVDPAAIRLRGPIALAWFSPDCTHHSKAKGPPPFAGRDCGAGTLPGSSSAGPAKRNPPSSCSRTSRSSPTGDR